MIEIDKKNIYIVYIIKVILFILMKNVVFVSVILVIINGKMDILYIKGCFFLYYVNIFFFLEIIK